MRIRRWPVRRWPGGGLSWRLAISYILVTLVAALTIEAAFAVGPVIQQLTNPDNNRTLDQVLMVYQARVDAYLASTRTPDQYDLQSQFLNILVHETVLRTTGTYGVAVLVNQQQAIVASALTTAPRRAHNTVPVPAGSASSSASSSDSASGALPSVQALLARTSSQTLIQEALASDNAPGVLSLTGADGVTTLAVPIWPTKFQQYGVLVVEFDGRIVGVPAPTTLGASLRLALNQLGAGAIYFVLLAAVLGTLTGIVISRNLRRRLRRITVAADAWSRGEFQVEVRDPSRDELGQLTRDLNSMAEQVQALLASRQELAVVAERNRLARDLHDAVKQHVFAATLQIAATRDLLRSDPTAAEQQLEMAVHLANEAQRELTALIGELRPPTLAGKGLVPALRELCAAWAQRMGIAAEVHAQGEQPTPLDVEQALFRVTQEALANVARHSGASAVQVGLTWEPDALSLTVTDNGRGFDATSARSKGVGLQSMRERASLLDGTLAVEANPAGTGARVVVRVPLLPLAASVATP